MVNSRESLAKIPSMNNDANPYIITLDIYKEGYWAYDISNYYKGRVDDNGTPFMVRWFEHGQLKNVQGLRPFIRGTVGQHTVDDQTDPDNPKVVPSPDCSQIDQTGETTDTAPGGIAIYRMVNQCFTQEGMFYGEIGLKDSSGLVLSSVDIAFKVLGGRMNMIGARKFYVSEFEKALDNLNEIIEKTKKDFSQELQKTINDARNAYNSEIRNAHDALMALDSQIQANCDEQKNLTQHLAGIEQQIAIHDVVTIPEFNKLDARISDRLSKMDLTPHMYIDEATMRAQNPNGTPNLCVTADTGHKWIWDYQAGNFVDAGPYNYALLDAGQKELLGTNGHVNNLIPDPDFKATNNDYWFEAHNGKPGIYTIDADNSIDESNIATLTEAGDLGSWIQTNDIPIGNHTSFSFRVYINCQRADIPAYFAIYWDKGYNATPVSRSTWNLTNQTNNQFIQIKQQGMQIPIGAKYFRFAVILPKGGTVKLFRPQANFGNTLLPYDYKDRVPYSDSDNLLPDSDFKMGQDYWMPVGNKTIPDLSFDSKGINGSNSAILTAIGVSGSVLQTDPIPIKNKKVLSLSAYTSIVNADQGAYMGMWFYDADQNSLGLRSQPINASNELTLQKMPYIPVPDNAAYFKQVFVLNNMGTLTVCRPKVNEGDKCLPYGIKEAREEYSVSFSPSPDNLIKNSDFKIETEYFASGSNGKYPEISTDPNNSFENSDVAIIKGNEPNGFWLQTDNYSTHNQKTLSIGAMLKASNFKAGETNPYLGIYFNDPASTSRKFDIPTNSDEFQLVELENLLIPKDATTFRLTFTGFNQQILYVARPQANFGGHLLKYSNSDPLKEYKAENNDIINPLFKKTALYWQTYSNGKEPTLSIKDDQATLTIDEVSGAWIQNTPISTAGSSSLSFGAKVSAKNIQDKDSQPYIGVWLLFNDGSQQLRSINITNSDPQFIKSENIDLPDGVRAVYFCLTGFNQQVLTIENPVLQFDSSIEATVKSNNDLPQMNIQTDQTIDADYVKAPFTYQDGERNIQGFLQVAIQGDSSRSFVKKNYKIKCFSDSANKDKLKWKPKSSWTANNKFNLKANWVDATQSRNLTNARIFERASDITPFENIEVAKKLSKAQALGQMEGFPIELYLNGKYNGLYTLNTKKDEKTFGMNSKNAGEEAIAFEVPSSQLQNKTAVFDGTDYSTIVQDQPTPELKNNFNAFLTFLNSSNDTDLYAHLKDYIDVHSVMNTYLWGILAEVWDTSAKSNLLLTYNNGKYFYMIPYDMDSTWSLKPDGNIYDIPLPEYDFAKIGDKSVLQFVTEENQMKLFNVMYRLFKPELKEQYFKLRQNVWSNSKIIDEYKRFIDSIPQEAYEREFNKWPQIPSHDTNNFAQIQSAIIERGTAMDSFMAHLTDTAES